jgi:4-hydroxyproline epimerase
MNPSVFQCIDAHTTGNPVRVVTSGIPKLKGADMAAKRLDFMAHWDWIRTGLMFEPRGHDMMSGSMFFPPHDIENDAAILFIETSGCLPMCGHGTIGSITIALERGLIKPKKPGVVRLETPAGLVVVTYTVKGAQVSSVKLINIPSFLAETGLSCSHSVLGTLVFDVAYGGNFYAIVDPQSNFKGVEHYTAMQLIGFSQELRKTIAQDYPHLFVHPMDDRIRGVSHIQWTGKPLDSKSHGRNAVFYGDKAIDRSPCGTGTSARMAQLHAKGMLAVGEDFVHESFIGATFTGRIESVHSETWGNTIIPSIEGWAKIYGDNRITIDRSDDPYALGFQVI